MLELTTEALALLPDDEGSPLRARLANAHARANLDRYRNEEAIRWLDTGHRARPASSAWPTWSPTPP